MADKLVINPIGGLANRMRAIASGISLAKKMGLDYSIVWPINSDLNCNYDELFQTEGIIGNVESISASKDLWLYDDPRKKNLYLSAFLQFKKWGTKITDATTLPVFLDNPTLLEETVKYTPGSVMIRSGLSYYPFSDSFYRSLFLPHEDFLEAANNRLGGENKKVVGLHIRRTDNGASIKYSPLKLFTEAMDIEIRADKEVKFYLATDDDKVKKQLMNIYGNRLTFSPFTAERKSPSGIKEALTEMLILSKCNRIYGSYWSSFSEAAAIIGATPFQQLKIAE